MISRLFLIWLLLPFQLLFSQVEVMVTGTVVNEEDKNPLPGVEIAIEGEVNTTKTDDKGNFTLPISLKGSYIITFSSPEYSFKRIPIHLEEQDLVLGTIILSRNIEMDKTDNLITLTDTQLLDEESGANGLALLQATRDIFLNRAAFDFGQAFFRVRGYDSQNGEIMINGIPMNKLWDGRPQWNNWGGLNDVVRNQVYSNGLNPSTYTFGGILGNTNIDLRPSGLRSGYRLSASASNRTYVGRLMATYNSGMKENGLAYIISASRRWANEGFINGTLYDAYSLYGALEYKLNEQNTVYLGMILASNRRGKSSALTQEVYDLLGKKYNPYWGLQNGKMRNSRERKINQPIIMLNYFLETPKLDFQLGMAYQTGKTAASRLGYYNAPNPDPTYYRYLPSFYINSPIGANFESAQTAAASFVEDPQIKWQELYWANSQPVLQGKAAYLLYDDVVADNRLSLKANGTFTFNPKLKMDFGVTALSLNSKNYAELSDLLGANYHQDIDPFSNTNNDVQGNLEKVIGDKFNYNYNFNANKLDAFSQFHLNLNQWKAFIAGQFVRVSYQREGLFRNERFLDRSLGKSDALVFSDFGVKGGITRKLNGRHWIVANGAYLTRAPLLQNAFVNPRESNMAVAALQSEKISTVDLNYFLRMPSLTGRLSGFYSRFQHTTDVNFFFVDAGVGSDFVQEVLTHLDKLHMGLELGLQYQLSPTVKLNGVMALSKYEFANDPDVQINFDTAGPEEDLIDISGTKNLGKAKLKGNKLAQGPQKAYAIGVEYRDPNYWWIALSANYLAQNYVNLAAITRTQSFTIDPETGTEFSDATPENVEAILNQNPLESSYLLNAIGGKSWLRKGKYLGIFLSINNLFDHDFKTGGYEQSRNGNFGQLQKDNLSGSPSFGPKYWWGYGRTYFLNIAFSF